MNIRHARDLALKILGIYYLFHAIVYTPQLCGVFAMWNRNPSNEYSRMAIAMSVLVPLLFWLVFGLLLTFKTSSVLRLLWPSSDEVDSTTPTGTPSMSFWIVLVGFFYFVGSFGGALSQLWQFVDERHYGTSYRISKLLPQLFTLALSVFCIIKAKAIEAWLTNHITRDSQQGHAG